MLLEDNDRYGVASRGGYSFKTEDEKEKAMLESIPVSAVYGITTFTGCYLDG